MNQIENKLESSGYTKDVEIPLVLAKSLLYLIDAEFFDGEGMKHEFKSAKIFHKGDRYVFSWSRFDQVFVPGHDNNRERRGNHSDGATHFDPNVEAVEAGFSHVLTVDVGDSAICLWKKAK